MSRLWAAEDGSWGSCDVVVIDTSDWTDEEIDAAADRLEVAFQYARVDVAQQILEERVVSP